MAVSDGRCKAVPEMWRPVSGFEAYYEVSDLGRVRSVARVVQFGVAYRVSPSRILASLDNGSGYKQVSLSCAGVVRKAYIHRIVASAFLPAPENEDVEVNHIDMNKSNNTPANLEWVTRGGNIRHALAHGVTFARYGDDHRMTKVPDGAVDALLQRKHWSWGEKAAVARTIGVASVTVTNIVNRRTRRLSAGGMTRSAWGVEPIFMGGRYTPCGSPHVSGVSSQGGR